MKKVLTIVLVVCLMLSLGITASADRLVTVLVGGEEIKADVEPKVVNSRIMLPVGVIFESLGATVTYDAATSTAVAEKDGLVVKVTVGSDIMIVGNETKTLDAPAFAENNRIFVPLRACAQAFGYQVDWINATYTAKIRKEVSLVSKIDHGDSYWEKYTYDNIGNQIMTEDSTGWWMTYTYDGNENLMNTKSSDGGYNKDYAYDENGALVYETNGSEWTKYTNDANGNCIKSETSYGYVVEYEYDARGNVVTKKNGDTVIKYEYDEYCRETKVSNGDYWKTTAYNEFGDVLKMEDSSGWWETYTYDENGNEVYVEDSNGKWRKTTHVEDMMTIEESDGMVTKIYFDETGKMVKKDYGGGVCAYFEYDENGNLIREKDDTGVTVEYVVVAK